MKRLFFVTFPALLVLVFSYTAISKFLDYDKFVFQMRLAPLTMMQSIAGILGWLVPSIEGLVVILLLFRPTRRAGTLASLLLFCIFEVYIIAMLATGSHLPCTCGGIISTMSWKQHLLFNAVFIAGCIAASWPLNTSKLFTRANKGSVHQKTGFYPQSKT